MVLAGMTARIDALPVDRRGARRGRRWPAAATGRKTFTASTLYDADGRVVACAEHVWVAVDPARLRSPWPSRRRRPSAELTRPADVGDHGRHGF